MSKENLHWGTTLDEFLTEDGTHEAAKADAMARVLAWQLSQEREQQGISKADPGRNTRQPRSG
jgi:hypothetical protein